MYPFLVFFACFWVFCESVHAVSLCDLSFPIFVLILLLEKMGLSKGHHHKKIFHKILVRKSVCCIKICAVVLVLRISQTQITQVRHQEPASPPRRRPALQSPCLTRSTNRFLCNNLLGFLFMTCNIVFFSLKYEIIIQVQANLHHIMVRALGTMDN